MMAKGLSSSASPKRPECLDDEFNQAIDDYEFFHRYSAERLDDYLERLREQSTNPQSTAASKKRVRALLMQLIFSQIANQINETEDAPRTLQHAALRWCSLIIKSPKIQEFHNQFADELAKTNSIELKKSSKAFNHYIRQPFNDR